MHRLQYVSHGLNYASLQALAEPRCIAHAVQPQGQFDSFKLFSRVGSQRWDWRSSCVSDDVNINETPLYESMSFKEFQALIFNSTVQVTENSCISATLPCPQYYRQCIIIRDP